MMPFGIKAGALSVVAALCKRAEQWRSLKRRNVARGVNPIYVDRASNSLALDELLDKVKPTIILASNNVNGLETRIEVKVLNSTLLLLIKPQEFDRA
ncbi:hypothetical protein D3C87_347660 [compost metagenome]